MDTSGHQSPERIRAGLGHPIIDAEGPAGAKVAAARLGATPAGARR
ncbi:MAG: hypothetical protein WEG40_10225 [Candidatus Rokuibacteriota bacterium]